MARLLLGALASLAVVSCTPLTYVEPASGDRARVRFATRGDTTVFYTYADEGCTSGEAEWLRVRAAPLLNSNPKRLGIPLLQHFPGGPLHENGAIEVYVDAKPTFHYMIAGHLIEGNRMKMCGVAFSYRFDANRDYEVEFDMQRDGSCTVTMNRIADAGAGPVRSRLDVFDNRVTASKKACLDRFKSPLRY